MSKVWLITGSSRGLGREFADFGVKVTIIEPGGFATRDNKNPDPLANGHMARNDPAYDGLRRRLGAVAAKQPAGDPAAAARALLKIVDSDTPPLRVLFGQGFYPMIQQAYTNRLNMWADGQDLSAEAHGNLDQRTA